MADKKINELRTATPALTDKLLTVGTDEEYILPISDLSNVIGVGDVSQLDTTAKDTLVNAINENVEDINNINGVIFLPEEKEDISFEVGGINANGNYNNSNTNRARTQQLIKINDGDNVISHGDYTIIVGVYGDNAISSANLITWIGEVGKYTASVDIPSEYVGYYAAIVARKESTDLTDLIDEVNNSIEYIRKPNNFGEINAAIDEINDSIRKDVNVNLGLSSRHYWNIETNKAVLTEIAGNFAASREISVTNGEIYTVCGNVDSTHKARLWVVTDDDYNIVLMDDDGYGKGTRVNTFTIPKGGTKLLITTRVSSTITYYLYKKETINNIINNEILSNKNVAIIGDSISTNGNNGDYPNAVEITITKDDIGKELSAYLTPYDVNAGLTINGHTYTTAEQNAEITFTPTAEDVGKVVGLPNNYNAATVKTWWEVASDELGFNPIPVCCSGASITSHEADSTNLAISYSWHDSQIRKCGIREEGSMNRIAPDAIFIYRITNDFSHNPYTVLTENYFDAANWSYPETDLLENGNYGFYEGYSILIKKLRTAYPNAKIFLCTPNIFKRVNYDHFPTNNGINTLPQYTAAVKKIADFFGCGVIDFAADGITFENCYTEGYITDNATTPTHPNNKGHYAMGQKAIADIKAQWSNLN